MAKVRIEEMTVATGPTHKLFSLRANGIPLQVSCTLKEFKEDHEKTMKSINSNFENSIRIIKLYGDVKKFDKKMLNVWTQTDTGVSCRANKLPIPEFEGFHFN